MNKKSESGYQERKSRQSDGLIDFLDDVFG